MKTVLLVSDVLAVGKQAATPQPRLDAVPTSVCLVIDNDVGVPALQLSDGKVLVVPWGHVASLGYAFDRLAELTVETGPC